MIKSLAHTLLASLLLLTSLSCKPLKEEETTSLKAGVGDEKATKVDLYKLKCKVACARIKNWGIVQMAGGLPTPKEEEVKLFDQKMIWQLGDWLKARAAKADTRVTVARDAGTQTPPAPRPADIGAAPNKSNFIRDHFAIDANGIHFSTSKNLRDNLEAEANQMDKKQLVDAAKNDKEKKSWWDGVLIDGGVHTLSTAERVALEKKKLAFQNARTEAIKKASGLYKFQGGGTSSFSFTKALEKFKKTEKIRVSTDFEVYHNGPQLTAEAYLAGKVLNRPIGKTRFIQLIAKAGVDSKTKAPEDNAKKQAVTINGGVSVRATFFGIDIDGFPKKDFGKIVDKAFTLPTIPTVDIPVYGFPGGGIVVQLKFLPQLSLGFDIDVKTGSKVTMTFDPGISLVMSAGVFAQAAIVGIGVEGTTTILAFEVPVVASLAWNPATKSISYMSVDYLGTMLSALGGTGVSIVAKLEVPSPFNYVLWSVVAASKLVGFKIPGEIGFAPKDFKYAYPIWEPEFKLVFMELAKIGGPRFLNVKKKPTAAQCKDLKGQIEDHIAFTKAEKDATSDEMLKKLDTASTATLVELQKDLKTKCPGT